MTRVALCRRDELVDGRLLVAPPELPDPLLVIEHAGEVHVLDGLCPHQYVPLADAPMVDGILTCARHGWRFRVSTGVSPDSPFICLHRWPVVLDDGMIFTEV